MATATSPTRRKLRKLSDVPKLLPAALRGQPAILKRREKQRLWATLSWDSERRSRAPSNASRVSRHSDGEDASEEEEKREEKEREEIEDDEERDLEQLCRHCALVAEYKRSLLRHEIENAVTRLARRLGAGGKSGAVSAPVSARNDDRDLKRAFGAPDIVVSSISSDEEENGTDKFTSSAGTSLQTSESSVCSSSSQPASAAALSAEQEEELFGSPSHLLCVSSSENPPRSNSVDLSTLQRELELFSISSASAEDDSSSPPTPTDSARTVRSRSHDPAATAPLRRPSRIEHLTVLFSWSQASISGRCAAVPLMTRSVIWEREEDAREWGRSFAALRATLSSTPPLNVTCKTTFKEANKGKSKESFDGAGGHHWIHRWKYEGRCAACSKTFHQKIFFSAKEKKTEPVAVTCSWCKMSLHTKKCFAERSLSERCDRGALRDLILPPPWIVRCTKKRKSPSSNYVQKVKTFVVRRNDSWMGSPSLPLLVFVNPKSGGSKAGVKALHTLCWLLNPRQVFDITAMKGPRFGLELFRKVVTQLRLLVCGGDGTVGWVLATLDSLNWPTYPPLALLPLGTGNDLSRCLGWGGAFSDEPLSQLLSAILHESSVTHLDRWRLDVTGNVECGLEGEDEEEVHSSLPLTVMNNYFSIGADAHVALQFHQSRSANPQMLNSRLKNRIAYGGLGTIDLFKRSWRDLSDFLSLECDGVDVSARVKELKLHCILFHNITYYAGGTVPWGVEPDEASRPSCCDGKIEVLGFTSATLAALQMGGRGERLAQCRRAVIRTTKAIPMQVDGEPCLLAPSIVTLSFHSKVPMLRREKKAVCAPSLMRKSRRKKRDSLPPATSLILQLPVLVVGRHDFDIYKDSLERLRDTAFEIGVISVEAEMELVRTRSVIQKLLADHPCLPYEYTTDWRFLDYVSSADEGAYRVSRQQEHVLSVSDASNSEECLLIVDDAFPSITSRSAAISSDLVFSPSSAQYSSLAGGRRISETLRIVLSSDAQETHL